ncbi:MAG: hypothetical protein RR162_07705 [Oscillospiraceae bacterium]
MSTLQTVLVVDDNACHQKKSPTLVVCAFVIKPHEADIIMFCLKNANNHSWLSPLKGLKYSADYYTPTTLYSKTKFFYAIRNMIDVGRKKCFVFFYFDMNCFKLISSFFGTAEEAKLIIYVALHSSEGNIYTCLFLRSSSPPIFLMHGENINCNESVIYIEPDVTKADSKNLFWSEVFGYGKQ